MAEVGSLSAKLTLDKSSFSSALSGAKGDLAAFGATAESGFSKLGTALGKAIQVGAAAAVVALGTVTAAATAGTKAFAAYEAGLADVGRVSGANADQLKALGTELRKMSMDTGTAVTDLEKLSVNLSAAGVAYEDLAGGTKLANSMMVAYGTSADKTGGFVGNLMKTYKMGTDDVKKFGSAMNVIEGAGKATPDYMMDYVGALSELNAMFDIDMKKAMAFGGVFADSNIQASEAATSLSSAISYALAGPDQDKPKERIAELTEQFQKMGMTAKEAKERANLQAIGEMSDGNERMTKWAKLLGVSYEELTQMLNTDFMGTMNKSAVMIGKITDNTKRLTVTNDIWGRYGTKSIAAVSGSIANYGDYINKIETDIINGSKSMEAEETRVYGTLSGMFNQAKQTMNDFGITIGEVTQGPLKDFLKWFLDSEPVITESLKKALSGDIFGAFTSMKPILDDIANGIAAAGEKLRSFIGTIDFNALFAQLQAKLGSIDFGSIWSGLLGSMGNIGEQVVGILGKSLTAVLNYDWEGVWEKVYPSAKAAFSKVGDAILSQPWGSWASRAMDLLGKAMQGAVQSAMDIGAWITQKMMGISSADFVSAGARFAAWILDGISNIAKLIKDNWANWIVSGVIITGKTTEALISFGIGMLKQLGQTIAGGASDIWKGLCDYTSSVASAAKTFGANVIDAVGMGIASGVNAAFKPITDFINEVGRKSNQYLGTNFSEMSPVNVGTGNTQGTSGDWYGTGGQLIDTALKPITDMVNAGGGGSSLIPQGGIGGLSLGDTLKYKNAGDMKGFLTEMGKQGKTFDEAMNAMRQVKFEGINMAPDAQKAAWGAGRGLYLNSQGGVFGGQDYGNLTAGAATPGATAATAAPGSAWNASGGILAMLNQGKGNSIVPGAYGVTGPVVEGTKVFVTNWPSCFGSGGSGNAMGCAVQSVDYGFGDNTKFTGSITPGGPGIGMVGSMSSTTPYANRLEVDTCEIDSFGMTPGLGAELAKSGAWSPIKGSPVSEKLAAEIGYKGNYSNVGNTAMVGSIKQAYERANKSQIQTQTKVNSIWTEGVSQAANNQAQIGQVVGGIMVQSASFGSNIQNNATNLWGSTVNSSAANHAAQSALAGQNILASATMGGNSINIAGNNLGSILASGSSGIGNAASTLTTATGGLTGSIGALQGLFDSQTSQFGTLLGSLNATALGLTTMGQSMGIPYGGAFVPAGGSSSGSNWGGTSISGAGGWVGSGSTMVGGRGYTTWGGTAASNAMSGVSAGSTVSWGGVTATRSSVSPSYWSSVISKRASGGMVNKPEVALIGEAGREAVLPNKLVETIMRGVDGGGSQMLHATINVDGRKLADVVGPAVVKRIQQGTGLKVR